MRLFEVLPLSPLELDWLILNNKDNDVSQCQSEDTTAGSSLLYPQPRGILLQWKIRVLSIEDPGKLNSNQAVKIIPIPRLRKPNGREGSMILRE